MNWYSNYEVRSKHLAIAWFLVEEDAEAFLVGLDPVESERYTIHEVKKIVTEDN